MMLLKNIPDHQAAIDLDDRNVVLVSIKEMGMYYVTGWLSITWTQMLEDFLVDKTGGYYLALHKEDGLDYL